MRCCVPFCKNTSTNVSTSDTKGISFHALPSEAHLRAAWLQALCIQDSHLLDSAMVCSQHFLDDDIHETESGLKQIGTGAIPSIVQVCMICLDTDSKLFLMSEHKLEEAYKMLTGYPLYDLRNLKQTLCGQCAQRLINFSRFRDKSLRARALMMDLVEKHEFITRQHIKMINHTKNQLNSDLVVTTLGPDHCDLYILDSSDKQTESEPIQYISVVKNEESYDSPVDEDMEVAEEDDNTADNVKDELVGNNKILSESEILETKVSEMPDPLKYESGPFPSSLCSEEFVSEHAYMQHMRMHDQKVGGIFDCEVPQDRKPHTAMSSSHSPRLTDNKYKEEKKKARRKQASSPSAHSPPNADTRGVKHQAIGLKARARIVTLHGNGLNISQIAREMGLSRNTVSRWVKRFEAEGTLKDRERPGRPPLITESQRNLMVHEYETNGFIPTERFACEFDTSVVTIRRVLHAEGLRQRRRPARKPRRRKNKEK
ncbi:uncharacterized protein LOC123879605 [Maniola jurtina]|uniref:uncharacterized protein LOC123879605 n=1 Tax=Maniola jurtina TaxID=191418 RepID=UPI001E68749B|nr:uncharacterized protein LOC123879605 [Maniola jurtina]